MKTHGLSGTNLYSRWEGIIQRVSNPKSPVYKHYGGRGITICEEWKSFIDFYNWAINNGYSKELEIDRINGDGNYDPSNCRWVDKSTNRGNVPQRQRNKKPNWGILKIRDKYTIQIWDKSTKKLKRFGVFDSEIDAMNVRDKYLKGLVDPKVKRIDKNIHKTKTGYKVHITFNKKGYNVGVYKTKEEALIKRDEFTEKLSQLYISK